MRDHRRSSKPGELPAVVIPPGHLEQLHTHRKLSAAAI
jgi:hypothetical protein